MQTQPVKSDSGDTKHASGGMDKCIQECLDCYKACLSAIPICLSKGGKHAEASHIATLMNCARICQTSAEFMISGSPLHTHTCKTCAEVCKQCGEECSRMGDEMKQCAEACKKCAESCCTMMAH